MMNKFYMEYQEIKIPSEVQKRLEELAEAGDPDNPPTLSAAGFFDWINKLSREDGWRMVWQGFNFPYVVLERNVETA